MKRKPALILALALGLGLAAPALALADAGPAAELADAAPAAAESPDAPVNASSSAEVPAADEPETEEPSAGDSLSGLVAAVRGGRWLVALGFGLMLLVWGIRKFLAKRLEWFGTKIGGFILAFGTALLAALGLGLSSGAGLSLDLFLGALGVAWAASGQHGHAKDLGDAARGS